MDKNSKQQMVAELAEKMAAAKAAFLTDYRGINVEQANTLRGELLKTGVEYRVVKNTLLKLAVQGTDNECLNEHLFTSYAHARQVINDWRNDYNNHRPHTSLEGLTPNEFATRSRKDHNVNRTNL